MHARKGWPRTLAGSVASERERGPSASISGGRQRHQLGHLGPTLRVELCDYDLLPETVRAACGTGSTVLELLGFAVVHLPAEANPVTAKESVERLPGVLSARS